MAPTNKGKGIFKCREVACSKTFTLNQNRSKHEKKFKREIKKLMLPHRDLSIQKVSENYIKNLRN